MIYLLVKKEKTSLNDKKNHTKKQTKLYQQVKIETESGKCNECRHI